MLEKTLKLGKLLDLYGGMLTDKQREAMDMYYNCDMSLAEVGEELSVSRQGVRDTLIRATNTLLELEDKIGYFKTLTTLKREIEDVAEEFDGKDKQKLKEIANSIEV